MTNPGATCDHIPECQTPNAIPEISPFAGNGADAYIRGVEQTLLVKVADVFDGNDVDGDTNGDLVVDVSDLLAVIGSWGPCP